MHRVVGVHLLQPQEQPLHQVVSILELDELEGHLASDTDDDGIRQQARVLHLLNAHHLWQKSYTHKGEARKKGGRHFITYPETIPRQRAKPSTCNKEVVHQLQVREAARSQ